MNSLDSRWRLGDYFVRDAHYIHSWQKCINTTGHHYLKPIRFCWKPIHMFSPFRFHSANEAGTRCICVDFQLKYNLEEPFYIFYINFESWLHRCYIYNQLCVIYVQYFNVIKNLMKCLDMIHIAGNKEKKMFYFFEESNSSLGYRRKEVKSTPIFCNKRKITI